MNDARTIAVYDDRADDYAARTDAFNRDDPRLAAFIAALPPGGAVLDLGCGPGSAAAVMAGAGLAVDAVDASAEMVRRAAAAGVEARQGSFDSVAAVAAYDGIWANFSLLHAPRADLPRLLAALHRALKPGGLFHIGMKLGTGASRDRIGRLYTYYSADDLAELLGRAGFAVTARAFGRDRGLDGTVSDWVCLTARA